MLEKLLNRIYCFTSYFSISSLSFIFKSVEVDRRDYEEVVLNEKTNNDFLKSKHNLNDEEVNSYRLNIRQASAWNENDVNIVFCKGGSEEIVNFFI